MSALIVQRFLIVNEVSCSLSDGCQPPGQRCASVHVCLCACVCVRVSVHVCLCTCVCVRVQQTE